MSEFSTAFQTPILLKFGKAICYAKNMRPFDARELHPTLLQTVVYFRQNHTPH